MGPPLEPNGYGDYPSHMRPIAYPSTEAEAAKAACNRIATMLQEDLGPRADLVTAARDSWSGVYRDEFDETWSPQSHRLDGLKDDLLRLVGAIDDLATDIASINQSRATQRENYEPPAPTPARGPI